MTKGSYLIYIDIPENGNSDLTIRIGKLGTIPFKKGLYCYVGSAMGKNGSSTSLEKRILRHTRTASIISNGVSGNSGEGNGKISPKMHWHIDYLLASNQTFIRNIVLIPSNVKEECILAGQIKKKSDGSVKNFGSSDCKCESHLHYFSMTTNVVFKEFL